MTSVGEIVVHGRKSFAWMDETSRDCVRSGRVSVKRACSETHQGRASTTLRKTHSCEDIYDDVDNAPGRFHSDEGFAKTRRNAIDFTPVDVTDDKINNNVENDRSNANNNPCNYDEMTDNDVTHDIIRVDDDSAEKNFNHISTDAENNCPGLLMVTPEVTEGQVQAQINSEKQYVWGKESDKYRSSQNICLEEMAAYYTFTQTCSSLCNTFGALKESLTFPNPASPTSRPITAKRLSTQLERCYAYMHGGHDLCDTPVICLPHYPAFRDVTEDDFRDVILYLTSVTSACAADVGFVLVIDRRRDKWSSLRGILVRLAGFFPGHLRMVLVLRPVGFFQGTISDIGFRWQRDEFTMKVTMLSSLDELFNYVKPSQLTQEFGGTLEYDHATWIRNRMSIEDFTMHATEVGKSLEEYGTTLAETELPNDITSTQVLIKLQQETTGTYKSQIDNLLKDAILLKNNIQTQLGGSILADSTNVFEADTLQSILSLIEEIDIAFEKFWIKHEAKLKQCLELRQFEQDYREVMSSLHSLSQWLERQSNNVATSINWVESLINELDEIIDDFKACSGQCSELSASGELLIENNHYAIDCIAPKCEELTEISTRLTASLENRSIFLKHILSILTDIEELNAWCDQALSLLAGQTLEKTQTLEGARHALSELESFFENENKKCPVSEESVSSDLENSIQNVNHRYDEVIQHYNKHRASLKKLSSRHGDRPVQLVEPSKKTKVMPPVANRGRTGKNDEKPSVSLNSSPSHSRKSSPAGGAAHSHNSDPVIKIQHVMNELLATERVYVEELKTIVEGYGHAIDDVQLADLVPLELKGNKTVLLGNMEDIYNFHGNMFLTELEECKDTPLLVGKCFIKRKEEFNIYCQYCQNSARSEQLRSRIGEQHPFFLDCQKRLGHRLSLSAYLLKPVQRITKYQLLLQQMLKYSSTHSKELQSAVQAMLAVLKSVNDSMHQTAISGYQGNLDELGKLLMQGPFSIQIDHKRTKVKNLTRARFSKALQRHLFLYEKELLFCKQQSSDPSTANDSNASSTNGGQVSSPPSGSKEQIYLFKNSLKMNAAGITETMKGDSRKFEIWYQGREDVYTLQAASIPIKQDWVREIKKVLASQPKSETTPPNPHTTDEVKGTKVKRSQSIGRKNRSAPVRTGKDTPKPEKQQETKKKSTLSRSASMGKGKDKKLKRKNAESIPIKKSSENLKDSEETAFEEPFTENRKSKSLPRLLDPPHFSDTDDTSDHSRTSSGCKFVVMKDRSTVSDDGEVILHLGDVIDVIETGKEGWVKVRIDQSGSEGWAPTSHIASLSDASSFESVSSYVST